MKQLTVCLLLLCLAGCGANANTELEKGNAFLARQDWDNAIACYTEAIRLDPNDVRAYNDRGNAYQKIGEKGKADADFAKAKELEPDK